MNRQVGVIYELEIALQNFDKSDLYSAGLCFFRSLDFPVTPSLEVVNVKSMKYYAFILAENKCYFTSDEISSFQFVINVSKLFSINKEYLSADEGTHDLSTYIIDFFALEIVCDKSDRSKLAFNLTKIMAKINSNPVIILFKHDNTILLSSALNPNLSNSNNDKVYLSDWFSLDNKPEEELFRLVSICFENHCDKDLTTLFFDIVHSFARPYYLRKESREYLFFELNSCFWGYEVIKVEQNNVLVGVYKCELNLKEYEPHRIYGNDYIIEDDGFSIMDDNMEWYVEHQDLVEQNLDEILLDMEDDFDTNEDDNFDIEEDDFDIELEDEIFDDAIKMLRFLDSLEEKKS